MKLYVASRASVPERPEMWRRLRGRLRAQGDDVTSTWIDEAGPGESLSMADLWSRIMGEVAAADGFVLYVLPEDMPLKGAFVEAGMALALGKPVAVVLPHGGRDAIGSWTTHSRVSIHSSLEGALVRLASEHLLAVARELKR